MYDDFATFRDEGIWAEIQSVLLEHMGMQAGRDKESLALAFDSQSVKSVHFISQEIAVDERKYVNGGKRHIAVEVMGYPLAIHVHSFRWLNFRRRLAKDYKTLVTSHEFFFTYRFYLFDYQ